MPAHCLWTGREALCWGGGDLLSVNLFCLHPLGFPSPIYMYVQVLLKFTQCTLHGSWTAWYLSLHTVTSHNIMWTRAPPSAHVLTTDIPYAWCIGTVIMPCLRKHMYTYIASGGSYTPPHDSQKREGGRKQGSSRIRIFPHPTTPYCPPTLVCMLMYSWPNIYMYIAWP